MTPQQAVQEVFRHMTKYYQDNSVADRYRSFRVGLFCKAAQPASAFPKLKGRAAEIKQAAPAIHYAFKALADMGDLYCDADCFLIGLANHLCDHSCKISIP